MKLRLVRSLIGRPRDQVDTAKALGLRRIGDVNEVKDTPEILGMVEKVKFLLEMDGRVLPKGVAK